MAMKSMQIKPGKSWLWVGLALLASLSEGGQIIWYNSAVVTYANGVTPLKADQTDWTKACFVQLICAGADQTNNPAIPSGRGVTGDDIAIDWGFMGQDDFLYENGIFPGSNASANLITNAYYFVRCWSGPGSNFSTGAAPVSSTNFYGDSRLWFYSGGGDPPSLPVEFDFASTVLSTKSSLGLAPRWHNGATALGGGWFRYMWFGDFAVMGGDWIWHNKHGFLYSASTSSQSMWLWSMTMGWLWTGETTYPFLYRLNDGAWIWYQKPSTNPQWFYNFSAGRWERH
jgi:hypothetical protein